MEFEEVDIQSIRFLCSDGGLLQSSLCPDITCKLPEGALTIGKKSFCRVSIQVMNTDESVLHRHMGKDAFVSPIVVIEPVRRKFHKSLTKTIPLPGFGVKKFESKNVRILFSITGSDENSDWQDISSAVSEKALDEAVEHGKLFIEHVVTGRFAVVCCENSIMDVPETMTEMMRSCMNGGLCAACNDQPHLDLLHAAKLADVSALKACLSSEGMDINYQNKGGQTALHIACKEGNVNIVKELLNHSADTNLYTQKGNTPIHLACYYGHLNVVELLLDNGCDVNQPSKDSRFPPLYPAIMEMQCDIVRLLLSREADVTWMSQDGLSLLLIAVFSTYDREKTVAMLQLLLKEVDQTKLLLSDQLRNRGFCCHGEALLYSVTTRQAAKDLIGPVRHKLASYSKDLWQKDLDSIENCEGKTKEYLHTVKHGVLLKVSEMLSQNNELHLQYTERDLSDLHCACHCGHADVTEKLISHGADVNLRTKGGLTCLYLAAQGGNMEIVKKLLKAGAETNTVNQYGLSASDIATEIGRLDIVSTIKDFTIRNEYQLSQKTNSSASKPKSKEDIAVKKCCSIL
ncbi:ankyrin-3-like [Mercenaria mercenaria]|uniref:ankyrin-3-like n=1 Tax=Mercenaria mercenaria TaxID=6596 RepID=UPI00234F8EA9|nr:ankyrin-3-like [Mercenaria mercenaria]XP_045213508.2 ankyrin-3-like [Mercenaria mercenaria]